MIVQTNGWIKHCDIYIYIYIYIYINRHTHSGVLFAFTKGDPAICGNVDGPGRHYAQ